MSTARIACLAAAALVLAIGPGCARKQEVSYQKDVAPLLTKHCAACHTPAKAEKAGGGFILFAADDAAALKPLSGREKTRITEAVDNPVGL